MSSRVQPRIEKKPGSKKGRQIGICVNSNVALKLVACWSVAMCTLDPEAPPPIENSPKFTPPPADH